MIGRSIDSQLLAGTLLAIAAGAASTSTTATPTPHANQYREFAHRDVIRRRKRDDSSWLHDNVTNPCRRFPAN
jgi:hypothetical protein